MPIFRFSKEFSITRAAKALFTVEGGVARSTTANVEQHENQAGSPMKSPQHTPEHEKKLENIKRQLSKKRMERSQISEELHVARRRRNRRERVEQTKRMKSIKQEIFRLKNEFRTAKEPAEGDPGTGALPDFVIIGAPKCGTTFLYHLLSKHPHVEPAAFKEPHYFDLFFDKGIEWYRQCFPQPQWKDGRRTVIGEATPGYLSSPQAPQRLAEVIPQARLIALLRNPIDRMYSAYQFFKVRHGRETGTFEETIETWFDRSHGERLIREGVYVDHLLRWSKFFSDEQMLVLKSEDFFERPQETLKRVLDFLDLPDWDPQPSELQDKRNKGSYEQRIDPTTRQRLEEYFEPHNRRLYEYLGVDFGW